MYYYSTIRLILIYRPSEGGSLRRPRHCSKCAARAKSCVSQWFSWKHKLLSTAPFEPGPSRAAGKRVTTRPLRPTMTINDGLSVLCICSGGEDDWTAWDVVLWTDVHRQLWSHCLAQARQKGLSVMSITYTWGESDIILCTIVNAAMLEVYSVAAVWRRKLALCSQTIVCAVMRFLDNIILIKRFIITHFNSLCVHFKHIFNIAA